MAVQPEIRTRMSTEAFDRFIHLPENESIRFEYIAGSAVKVSSNTIASKIAATILILLGIYLEKNDTGHVTGADGGYMVAGERYIPDVGYVAYTKQPEVTQTGYNPLPPDLAVEVISDPENNNELQSLRRKITNYLLDGTTVWVFDWQTQEAEAHTPGEKVQIYTSDQVIPGGDILPGFELPLNRVFR